MKSRLPELSASIRFRRARGRWEGCGRPHGRVVLATAHRDHDPPNKAADNLAAFCQQCRILHNKAEHLRWHRLTYLSRRAMGDLFTGPYVAP